MKNRTRLSALALTGALSLSLLTACSSKDSEPTSTPEETTPAVTQPVEESQLPEETQLPEASDVVETPVHDPLVSQAPSAAPSEKPAATPAPTTQPTAAPTATPEPSQTVTESSKVQATWNAITSQIELPALESLDDDFLTAIYGIDPADLVEYVAQVPSINVTATEFFIAQVADGKMDTIKAALQKRQADLEAEWQNYLPEQLELVQNYRLVSQGSYVMFCIGYDTNTAVSLFNANTK